MSQREERPHCSTLYGAAAGLAELRWRAGVSLYEVFVRLYGDVDSKPHCAAREAFVRSMAAYAVVCMVLKLKDRYTRTRTHTRVHARLREAWRCDTQHTTGNVASSQRPSTARRIAARCGVCGARCMHSVRV